MAKFNTRGIPAKTVTTFLSGDTTATGTTYEGAPGFARDAKSELFLLGVTNFVGEETFYEKSGDRDARFKALAQQVAVADPDWMRRFVGWLRNEANMRSAALVAALDGASAMVTAKVTGARQLVAASMARADEPGEAVAYWLKNYGAKLPKPIKRGIGDVVRRLYNEYTVLKYDTTSKRIRFSNVLNLTHPTPATPVQGALFQYILDRNYDHVVDEVSENVLPMIAENIRVRANVSTLPAILLDAVTLKAAGLTWEDALSLAGQIPGVDKRLLWEALVPTLGYMALLRNLRNLDEVGVHPAVVNYVTSKLADPEQVARSRQLPFRFLSAHRAVQSVRWTAALEAALNLSLRNVPELPGKTLVLVDRSGSMFDRFSAKGELTRADTAALFGSALALRNIGRVTLVEFGSTSAQVQVPAGASLLRMVNERFHDLGGTETQTAVKQWYQGHDRVVIVTDEQVWNYRGRYVGDGVIPEHVPMYTWNLAGYKYGQTPITGNKFTFGGLTDQSWGLIQLLERGKSQDWPF